ncbi:hypothetical protein PoB_005629600 [Plakobranchus ocellatus]|uniref:Uncharacterized protein n=1 Tax=Plakobranchus ocellatus TaxID=259542 RepID=A0AAV4CEK8_9GAST|nr:hypothetical protein PoB_005629600 [Plakobranchus ocellatus]
MSSLIDGGGDRTADNVDLATVNSAGYDVINLSLGIALMNAGLPPGPPLPLPPPSSPPPSPAPPPPPPPPSPPPPPPPSLL